MYQLISSKYFNKKETLLDSFMSVCNLMERHSPLVKNKEFQHQFLQTVLTQIIKFSSQNVNYKNNLLKCMTTCLGTSDNLDQSLMEQIAQTLKDQLTQSLEHVSGDVNINHKEKSLDERKDDERWAIQTVI